MNFRLAPKSVTLNDLEQRNGPYFALFHRIRLASRVHCVPMVEDVVVKKSSRSLSDLLVSFLFLKLVSLRH